MYSKAFLEQFGQIQKLPYLFYTFWAKYTSASKLTLTFFSGLFPDVFCYGSYFFSRVYFKIKPFIKGERQQSTNLFEFSLTECIWTRWTEMMVQKTEKHQPVFQSIVEPKIVTLKLLCSMSPHSSTLAWKIPWTEEPGGLQSMGSLRVGHDWATSLYLFTFMHWRRKWQPTPVFLPGESQGWRSLVGCRLQDHTESDTTEVT